MGNVCERGQAVQTGHMQAIRRPGARGLEVQPHASGPEVCLQVRVPADCVKGSHMSTM